MNAQSARLARELKRLLVQYRSGGNRVAVLARAQVAFSGFSWQSGEVIEISAEKMNLLINVYSFFKVKGIQCLPDLQVYSNKGKYESIERYNQRVEEQIIQSKNILEKELSKKIEASPGKYPRRTGIPTKKTTHLEKN
jgi:hypothetical protein